MPVSRVGKRRQVVLPKAVCEAVGLVEGDFVEVTTRRGRVEIQPKRLVDLEDTLTPEEEKIVAKGFRQLKRGQFVTWDQLKNEVGR